MATVSLTTNGAGNTGYATLSANAGETSDWANCSEFDSFAIMGIPGAGGTFEAYITTVSLSSLNDNSDEWQIFGSEQSQARYHGENTLITAVRIKATTAAATLYVMARKTGAGA